MAGGARQERRANAKRAELNSWIRRGKNCSGSCAGTVDFDAVLAWPLDPDVLRPDFDSGDTIHPNTAGYAAMARSIDLTLFNLR